MPKKYGIVLPPEYTCKYGERDVGRGNDGKQYVTLKLEPNTRTTDER